MSKATAASEPSMEEILASIRQIITDDNNTQSNTRIEQTQDQSSVMSEDSLDAQFVESETTEAENIIELTEDNIEKLATQEVELDVNVEDTNEHSPEFVEGMDVEFDTNTVEESNSASTSNPKNLSNLLSNETAQSISSSLSNLSKLLVPENKRTLEDLVQDMLRPILKEWLNENLPILVERIVTDEINRIVKTMR